MLPSSDTPTFHDIDSFLDLHGLSDRHARATDSAAMVATLYKKAGLTASDRRQRDFMVNLPDSAGLILHITSDQDQTKTQLYSLKDNYKVVIDKRNNIYQAPRTSPLTVNEYYDLKRINFQTDRDVMLHAPYLTQHIKIHRTQKPA